MLSLLYSGNYSVPSISRALRHHGPADDHRGSKVEGRSVAVAGVAADHRLRAALAPVWRGAHPPVLGPDGGALRGRVGSATLSMMSQVTAKRGGWDA